MCYFYYFIDSSGFYYGGITSNVARRQKQHRKDQRQSKKSTAKCWHLLKDLIVLNSIWGFETRAEATIYEKQWIASNYNKTFCLNHSTSGWSYGTTKVNKGCYDYKSPEHKVLSEKGGGYIAKKRFAKNLSTGEVFSFSSSKEACKITGVKTGEVSRACKYNKARNGAAARWLFSLDLVSLTVYTIRELANVLPPNSYNFVIYSRGSFSGPFTNTCHTSLTQANLSKSLRGIQYQTVCKSLVLILARNNEKIADPFNEYLDRFKFAKMSPLASKLYLEALNLYIQNGNTFNAVKPKLLKINES